MEQVIFSTQNVLGVKYLPFSTQFDQVQALNRCVWDRVRKCPKALNRRHICHPGMPEISFGANISHVIAIRIVRTSGSKSSQYLANTIIVGT